MWPCRPWGHRHLIKQTNDDPLISPAQPQSSALRAAPRLGVGARSSECRRHGDENVIWDGSERSLLPFSLARSYSLPVSLSLHHFFPQPLSLSLSLSLFLALTHTHTLSAILSILQSLSLSLCQTLPLPHSLSLVSLSLPNYFSQATIFSLLWSFV